jgi:hypothetical protein
MIGTLFLSIFQPFTNPGEWDFIKRDKRTPIDLVLIANMDNKKRKHTGDICAIHIYRPLGFIKKRQTK